MFTIKIPNSHENEIKWVLSIIFDYVLGIQCEIITSSIDEIILSKDDRSILLNNSLF